MRNFVAFFDLAPKLLEVQQSNIGIVKVTFRICVFLKSHQHITALQSIHASFREIKKDVNNFFVYAQNTKQSVCGRMHAYFSSTFNSRQILISKQIKQMKSEGARHILPPSNLYPRGRCPLADGELTPMVQIIIMSRDLG